MPRSPKGLCPNCNRKGQGNSYPHVKTGGTYRQCVYCGHLDITVSPDRVTSDLAIAEALGGPIATDASILTETERRRLRESLDSDDPCLIYDAEESMAVAIAECEGE